MPYCFGIKNIELAVAQLATYDEVGPFYIYPLCEGSDDCWDYFYFLGEDFSLAFICQEIPLSARHCAVWTGTADREVLAQFRATGN